MSSCQSSSVNTMQKLQGGGGIRKKMVIKLIVSVLFVKI
jgi:hypothetical protein